MSDYWNGLRLWAETYHDLQKQRIAIQLRVTKAAVDIEPLLGSLEGLAASEKMVSLGMRRAFRTSGFRDLCLRTKGVGEHLLARLLGHMGDPAYRINIEGEATERTLGQLWAYCGHGDASRKRRAGMSQEEAFMLGNPKLKMLTHLIAESCMKQKPKEGEEAPKFRAIYEERRAHTLEKEGWTDLHKHNDALRIVGKEFLRDLWLEARGLHGLPITTPNPTLAAAGCA